LLTCLEQEQEQGQLLALRAHSDQLLATLDAQQAALPADDVQTQLLVGLQRVVALQFGQRYAEADAVLAQFISEGVVQGGVWAFRADNQLQWGMAEAHAGREQEAFLHYQQGLEWIAREVALGDSRSEGEYLELQAKLQQAVAEGYSREGTTPPLSPSDPS
jgi:hypothetical protein